MTAPESPGGPSPLRVGGLALVGVAVVAAIIGLATLASGGSNDQPTAAPPAPPSAPPAPPTTADALPPQPSPPPTLDGSVPVPSFSATPTGPAAPPAPGAAQGDPGSPAAPAPGPKGSGDGSSGSAGSGSGSGPAASDRVARAPLRVYNNSTISGLAARAADDFRAAGWPVEVVDNYPYGIIPTSTVYYQPGTAEEAPARELGAEFGLRVNPRFEGLRDASPGIIVIVTNDYRRSAS